MKRISIINGPNINMMGFRDKEIYKGVTLGDVVKKCDEMGKEIGVEVDFFQSNSEGEIVEKIQNSCEFADGIIINPGALTHYSIAIRDALEIFKGPKIEVHFSNIFAREEYRRKTVTGETCDMVISGGSTLAYQVALRAISQMVS